MSPLAWSISPMTVLGGELKSFTAEPSRKNFGIVADAEVRSGFLPGMFLQDGYDDVLHSARQNRAANYDRVPRGFVSKRLANLLANVANVSQVEIAIGLTWRPDAN